MNKKKINKSVIILQMREVYFELIEMQNNFLFQKAYALNSKETEDE